MEDRCVAVFGIGKDLADGLPGADLISCLYIHLAQVAINSQVVTMPDMTELL